MIDILGYAGKRVVIAGCFSGMGEACARTLVALGAEVHGVDIRPSPVAMASFTELDLKDWNAIERVVEAIGGEVDAVFNCAGLPQTFPAVDVLSVNFIGLRHWTNLWLPRMRPGSAIVTVSSNAARSWGNRMALLQELVALEDPTEALEWVHAHPDEIADGYGFSKEAIAVWTQQRAVDLIKRGIRINCTFPSPTATPMMKDFEIVAGQAILNIFAMPIGRQATAEEQALPLILLNSQAASFVSGVCLPTDAGFTGGVATGLIDLPALLSRAMAAKAA
jgi:NAD(P)-dependent dehydrogenase (short-subunit alcohol dehydrogenase family)